MMKSAKEESVCYPHQPVQSCPGFHRGNVWKLGESRKNVPVARVGSGLKEGRIKGPFGLEVPEA